MFKALSPARPRAARLFSCCAIGRIWDNSVMGIGLLRPVPGSRKKALRQGRGDSARRGNTGGRGNNGHKARPSYVHKLMYEGGQTPLTKRYPKYGAKPDRSQLRLTVALSEICAAVVLGKIDPAKVITLNTLLQAGVINHMAPRYTGVNLVHSKKKSNQIFFIPKGLNIQTSAASQRAIDAIETSGGTYTAMYFNPVSLRAHLKPHKYIFRMPRFAPPIRRKAIEFYTNPANRGYLAPFYRVVKHPSGAVAAAYLVDKKTGRGVARLPTMDIWHRMVKGEVSVADFDAERVMSSPQDLIGVPYTLEEDERKASQIGPLTAAVPEVTEKARLALERRMRGEEQTYGKLQPAIA